MTKHIWEEADGRRRQYPREGITPGARPAVLVIGHERGAGAWDDRESGLGQSGPAVPLGGRELLGC